MVGGAVVVALCLLALGWTAEIVGLFVTEPHTVSGHNEKTSASQSHTSIQAKSCTIALAVLAIYAVDFAINAGSSTYSVDMSCG